MSKSLATRASEVLAARTSRRGFLARSAVVGSALAVAPSSFILRPGTAYASVCTCSGSSCDCSALCCDGYTEFCCTLTGLNTCPSGTAPGGWWKADGSGLCDLAGSARPRYYIDCNVLPNQHPCSCGCALGSCAHRHACCTVFRYGQCHQEIPGVRAIMCRVVTCVPPWIWDPSCTTTSATDDNTRFHDAPCLHKPPVKGFPATFRNGEWTLRDGFPAGSPTTKFVFGQAGDNPIFGDWNGDGTKTVGVVRGDVWYLRNSNSAGPPDITFSYGNSTDIPIVGDWNGDGIDTPGVFRGGHWYLRNSNTSGVADISFDFGNSTDIPVVGDWNGDAVVTPGVVRGTTWYLRNSNTTGVADITFDFGAAGDDPMVGDWNGDGTTNPGRVNRTAGKPSKWQLRNTNTAGPPDIKFTMGHVKDEPRAWGHP